MNWFTSDTHFGHSRVIEYCNRPFSSVDEMDAAMVQLWNERVHPEDRVYHLGDFAFRGTDFISAKVRELNGRIVLVRGNHDQKTRGAYLKAGMEEVFNDWAVIDLGLPCGELLLRHRPDYEHVGFQVHLCGHVHEKWKRQGNVVNVGVDVWKFRPISIDEALADLVVSKCQ